jgi:hypothetical protein
MALNAGKLEAALKSALKSALDAEQGPAPAEGDGHRTKFCNAVAKAVSKEVVDHIVSNMEVKGIMIQVDPASYVISVFGGMGIPAINFPNPPLLHKQMNDGIGLIK